MKILDKIKTMVAALAVAALGVVAIAPAPAMAYYSGSQVRDLYGSVGKSADSGNTVWDTIKSGINLVMGIIGLIAVIMIIYGGFQYMTSSGDTSKVTKAKNTIMYGVIGLVIVVLAFAIVNFVVSNLLQ